MIRERVEKTPRKAFTKPQRAQAFLAGEGRCCFCREKIHGSFDVDHRIPLAHGGKHELSNWQVAHAECHREKSRKEISVTAHINRLIKKHDPDREKPPSRWGKRAFQKSDMKRRFDGTVVKR